MAETAKVPVLGIVEDDVGTARLEQRAFEREGYRVRVFTDSAAVVDDGALTEVDCWLVDQGLEGARTGLELVAELRRRGVEAPVVMVTGNDDPKLILTALREGVSDYVRKGDDFLELLLSRVAVVLRSARAANELRMSRARAELEAERRRELEAEIQERRRAELQAHAALARLRDMDRRKDEFLAMLGHELRNPLAPIASAVEVLRQQGHDVQRVAWASGVIGRQVDQMRRIVDDLLDVARIMNGRLVLRREVVDLREVVRQAVERVQPTITARSHRLGERLCEQECFVAGDAVRLVQVVANLLENAAKYTNPGGNLEVQLRRVGDETAELVVTDDGIGMAPDMLEALFGLFVQGERSADRADGGLGLGLALVRRLVSLHRGSVIAASDGPGKGSAFTVRLPLCGNPAPVAPAPEAMSPPMQRRVLVVDDNRDAADAVAVLLGLWGCEVHTANDGDEALQALLRHDPDAVLLDIGLPRRDGYAVLAAAREQDGERQRLWIAVTGYGQESDRERSRAAGFAGHLTKPVAPEALRAALAPLFGGASA